MVQKFSLHPLDQRARTFDHFGIKTEFQAFKKYIELTGDEDTTLSLASVIDTLTEFARMEIEVGHELFCTLTLDKTGVVRYT